MRVATDVTWSVECIVDEGITHVDVLRLITDVHINSISAYIFDAKIPRFIRALSLFHLPLPVLLLWMVERLGYDRRAWLAQTALAWCVLLGCYLLSDPAQNINWVFGPGERPQSRMPAPLYLARDCWRGRLSTNPFGEPSRKKAMNNRDTETQRRKEVPIRN